MLLPVRCRLFVRFKLNFTFVSLLNRLNFTQMELKKIYSRKEIAEMYKISVKTLERKLKPFKKMFAFDKRKRIYTETEVNFIKSIFK